MNTLGHNAIDGILFRGQRNGPHSTTTIIVGLTHAFLCFCDTHPAAQVEEIAPVVESTDKAIVIDGAGACPRKDVLSEIARANASTHGCYPTTAVPVCIYMLIGGRHRSNVRVDREICTLTCPTLASSL